MKCSQCGIDLAADATFCGNCGAQIIKQTPSPTPAAAMATPQPFVSQDNQNPGVVSSPSPSPSPEPVQSFSPTQPVSPSPAPAPSQPMAAPNPYQAGPLPTPAAPPTTYAVPKEENKNLSIASMVCGILAMLTCLIWFLALPLGVAALVMGILGKSKGGKSMALAGIITGALGLILTLVITAAAISYLENNPEQQSESYRESRSSSRLAIPFDFYANPKIFY